MAQILIKNVDVFDGRQSRLAEHQNIVITDNLVTDIFGGPVSEEQFDQVIDGRGQTAIPGLIDAHVHLGGTFFETQSTDYDIVLSTRVAGALLLEQGVTTVRDAGGVNAGLKRAIDEGLIPGPRIYSSGSYISQTCGHGDSPKYHAQRDIQHRTPTMSVLADGVPEVLRAVREQFYKGAVQIKLMAGGGFSSDYDPIDTLQFSYEEIKAAVDAAEDYGTYVMTHLYTAKCADRAIKAGVRSLEHAHAISEENAKAIKDKNLFLAPMPQMPPLFTQEDIEKMAIYRKSVLPRRPKGDHIMRAIGNTTELINKYNLNILFGTDLMIVYPDCKPKQNLNFMRYKERFGSFRGLYAATGAFNDLIPYYTYQNPYQDGKIGVLEKGSYADLLIVKGNPVEDLDVLGDTDNLRLIMKDGNIYKNTLETL